jgi:hypothetical protein
MSTKKLHMRASGRQARGMDMAHFNGSTEVIFLGNGRMTNVTRVRCACKMAAFIKVNFSTTKFMERVGI